MSRHRRTPGRRALTALHVSLLVLCAFAVAVLGLVALPDGRVLVEQHFSVVRLLSYLAWGVGFGAFALSPVLLLRELGIVRRLGFSPSGLRIAFDIAGMPGVGRAYMLGAVGNGLVLLASPLGVLLGERYTWPVFCLHLVVSALVVAFASFGALVRMRDFVSELQPLPVADRASHAVPAAGV